MRRRRSLLPTLLALAMLALTMAAMTTLAMTGPPSAAMPAAPGTAPVPAGSAVLTVQGFVGTDGAWHYQLWHTSATARRAVTTDPWLDPGSAALSPEGGQVAYTVGNSSHRPASGLYVTRIDGSGTRNLLAGDHGFTAVRAPAWSPDGRRLAFVGLDHGTAWDVWTIRADGTGLTRETRCGCAWENTPRWSPVRDELLWSPRTYDLAVLDLRTGRSTTLYDHAPSGAMNVLSYGWSPDGSSAVFSGSRWNESAVGLHTVARDGGPASALLLRADRSFSTPYWSADGRYLAASSWPVDTSPGGTDGYVDDAVVIDLEGAAAGVLQPWALLPGPLRDRVVGFGPDCGDACAPGGRWSQLSVRAETLADGVWVAGGLLPGLSRERVNVTIERQRQRRWVTFARRGARTTAEAVYSVTMPRRAGQLCRVTVSWAGDADHGRARARTRPFGC